MLGEYAVACESCSKALKLKPDYTLARRLWEELRRRGYCSGRN